MYTKEQITDVLSRVYEDSRMVLFGEQLGHEQEPNIMLGRYSEATGGKAPAVMGIDFGCYGLFLKKIGVGSEKWNTYIEQIVDFADKGGIVTASCHFENPYEKLSEGNNCRGGFGREDMWDEMLTEGTELNRKIKEELIIDGTFLRALADRGVTVLWRPLHEANGGWFWFCARTSRAYPFMDGSHLIRFWRYMYELFTVEMKLDNLLWVYSPALETDWDGNTDSMLYYPGDEYVDLCGVDWYTRVKTEIFNKFHSYDRLMAKKKPCCLAEFGPNDWLRAPTREKQAELFNTLDMVDIMKEMVKRGLKLTYVLTWCGSCGVYKLGRADEAVKDPFFIDLEKLQRLYK